MLQILESARFYPHFNYDGVDTGMRWTLFSFSGQSVVAVILRLSERTLPFQFFVYE